MKKMITVTERTTNSVIVNVTKSFEKKSRIYGTEEYKLWSDFCRDITENHTLKLSIRMETKTIKKKLNKKSTTKNMTYENMKAYINTQDDAKELMVEFNKELEKSKVAANPYRAVLAWFMKKFSNVNDYMDFFEGKASDEAEGAEHAA